MRDRTALVVAGVGNIAAAMTLLIAPAVPTPLWVSFVMGLCAGIGTASLLRASVSPP